MANSTAHTNHMGCISYTPDSILKLKMITCSQFLKETQSYYRSRADNADQDDSDEDDFNYQPPDVSSRLNGFLVNPEWMKMSTMDAFHGACQETLDAGQFLEFLELAVKTRTEFMMRKNPQMMLAVAAAHPGRIAFNASNPKVFRETLIKTWLIPGDMKCFIDAWKGLKGSKSGLPTFVKKAMAEYLNVLTPYKANKYRRDTIDMVRIAHPSKPSVVLKELMETGKVVTPEADLKWETLRAQGKTWPETLEILQWRMPHMAALRNLLGFARAVRDETLIRRYCEMVEGGVEHGMQFPYRYVTALDQLDRGCKVNAKSGARWHPKRIRKVDIEILTQCLENCLQRSIANFPSVEGDVCALSDNSGSAHGAVTSQYGTKTVAQIGNLSALLTAYSAARNGHRGVVGVFGDELHEFEVTTDRSILEQYKEIDKLGKTVGQATENGIWLFFRRAFADPSKYSFHQVYFYSDMQAGHGGLYGCDPEMSDEWLWASGSQDDTPYIHIPKLIDHYRKVVNPKVNIFTVQTAGYDDSIIPGHMYRGAILTGWTGNEVAFGVRIAKLWDEIEAAQV